MHSRTIKRMIINRNNLATLGSSPVPDSCQNNLQSSPHKIRLKSLSQQRNIKKIIKMIESPSHEELNQTKMLEEIHGLAEQYQHICQSAHTVVDKSLKKTLLLTRCVPRSRINLLTSQHGHKENGGQYGANTSINSCQSMKSLNMEPLRSESKMTIRRKKGIRVSLKEDIHRQTRQLKTPSHSLNASQCSAMPSTIKTHKIVIKSSLHTNITKIR